MAVSDLFVPPNSLTFKALAEPVYLLSLVKSLDTGRPGETASLPASGVDGAIGFKNASVPAIKPSRRIA